MDDISYEEHIATFDQMYRDLLATENGNWSLSEIDNADYNLLMELFNEPKKTEKKQDPVDFFAGLLSPEDLARAKGETP